MLDRVKGWLRREPRIVVPKTILVVDGNTNDRRSTAASVAQLGYQALEAGTIDEALEQLDEHQPDCVLLAFDVPGGEGLDALDKIREKDSSLEIVMLAADWRDSRTAEAMRRGAIAYLAKPFSQTDLRELLARR